MLELRKGSKDLFEALELLRTAPEENVAAILLNLRGRGSVSDFLQSIDSGTVGASSPLSPLTSSLVGTWASSAMELDLNMRYPNVFPTLETLTITEVDIGLLADDKRGPRLSTSSEATSSEATSISPFSPIDFSGRQPATPTTSESFSTPSDTTGDSSQQSYIDHRLEGLQIWQWTSVPIPETLAEQTISFYLSNEHPLLAFFDANLFIRDFVAGGGRFCSPVLVSALLAWSCVSCYIQHPCLRRSLMRSRPLIHNSSQGHSRYHSPFSRRQRSVGGIYRTTTASLLLLLPCSWPWHAINMAKTALGCFILMQAQRLVAGLVCLVMRMRRCLVWTMTRNWYQRLRMLPGDLLGGTGECIFPDRNRPLLNSLVYTQLTSEQNIGYSIRHLYRYQEMYLDHPLLIIWEARSHGYVSSG